MIAVRPLRAEDQGIWRSLWTDYLAFYESQVGDEVYETTFARLLSGAEGEFRGRLAWEGARAVGLVHFLSHRHCWRVENVIYLQDLYVAPESRGSGAGRALIEAVYAEADAARTPEVYWTTQAGNTTARRLYDRIGTLTPFIKYQRSGA